MLGKIKREPDFSRVIYFIFILLIFLRANYLVVSKILNCFYEQSPPWFLSKNSRESTSIHSNRKYVKISIKGNMLYIIHNIWRTLAIMQKLWKNRQNIISKFVQQDRVKDRGEREWERGGKNIWL